MLINKLLKTLFAIEFVLILVIIILFSIGSEETLTAYVVKENVSVEKVDFKIFTKAVCEEGYDSVFCHDKLFVKCNGKEYIVDDNLTNFIYCNNLKLNLSDYKVNGSGIFKKQ